MSTYLKLEISVLDFSGGQCSVLLMSPRVIYFQASIAPFKIYHYDAMGDLVRKYFFEMCYLTRCLRPSIFNCCSARSLN